MMNKQFLTFIDRIGRKTGNTTLCEAIKDGYRVCCEAEEGESGMDEYDAAAERFLAETGTSMSVGEPEYGPHFVGEKDSRWSFPVTFRRDGRQYTTSFGQSIAKGSEPPRAYDVLAALVKYEPGDFHDFCSDYGYQEFDDFGRRDKSMLKLYNGVCREWKGVERLWGDSLDALREIS